jgi:hypothetical protein
MIGASVVVLVDVGLLVVMVVEGVSVVILVVVPVVVVPQAIEIDVETTIVKITRSFFNIFSSNIIRLFIKNLKRRKRYKQRELLIAFLTNYFNLIQKS